MSQGSTQVGRQGSTGTFQNTIAPKSAEQAMLLKLDEIINMLNALQTAVAGSTTGDDLQAALFAALTAQIAKISLVR